jgi:hypothetical protein
VVTAARLAVTRTNTFGHPVRLVFDIDQGLLHAGDERSNSRGVGRENLRRGRRRAPSRDRRKEPSYADGIVKGPGAKGVRRSPSAATKPTARRGATWARASSSGSFRPSTT